MKKSLLVILLLLTYSNCVVSQVNGALQNKLKNKGFSNYPIHDMAFAIEELDELISSDTSYIGKWKEYVTPISKTRKYINMYIAQKKIFLEQLEQKKSAISIENYKLMKSYFANIEYDDYLNYGQFVDAFVNYPEDVNTFFTVALLTVGDEEFREIENSQQFNNLKFWLSEGIYSMRFNFSSMDYVVPINCRVAEYLNEKHANSHNEYIKQGVSIFNEFLEKHKGEY